MKQLQDIFSIYSRLGAEDSIVMHSAFSEPRRLANLLAEHAPLLSGVNVYALMPMGRSPYAEKEPASHLKINTFFPGTGLRSAFNSGRVNALRYPLSEIPGLFHDKMLDADLLLLKTSLPDKNGYVSLGVSVDYMRAAASCAPTIIAEVSEQVPQTCGNTRLPVTDIDWFLESESGPYTVQPSEADDIDERIADNIASLIGDGAVLQIGIGSLPERVLAKLGHLRHLGVHSGIISDAIRPLIESGVVDNTTKKRFAGVSVTTMAGGTQEFYNFLHQNKAVEFHPCSLTHSASELASIDRLTAVNSALQVDLTGCANAEAVKGKLVAMPGGLPDFAAGASSAKNGMSIIALRSTFNQDSVSNIVADLGKDSPKTLSFEHIDYIVTEYGVARVSSVDSVERSKGLISVAHPKFRESLERQLAGLA